MPLAKQLLQLLEDKSLSQRDFTQITGYPQVSLSKITTGSTKNPGIKILEVVEEHFPEVNLRWLLTGKGEMYRRAGDLLPEIVGGGNDSDPNLAALQTQMLEIMRKQNEQYEAIIKKNNPELAKQLGLL